MTYGRDVAAFDARAGNYESGWRGRLHQQIADRTAELALTLMPAPQRILDVGCGTGYLLRQLAARCPRAVELAGVDPASGVRPDCWQRPDSRPSGGITSRPSSSAPSRPAGKPLASRLPGSNVLRIYSAWAKAGAVPVARTAT